MSAWKFALAVSLISPVLASADPPSTQQQTNWSGCYGGVTGGYIVDGRSKKENTVDVNGAMFPGQTNYVPFHGAIGGINTGCNLQANNIVVGPELEGWYQDVNSSSDIPNTLSPGENIRTSIKSNLAGAASLKLGYALDNFLIYAKGGAAVTSFRHPTYVNSDTSGVTLDKFYNGKHTSVGYLVGGGVEMALSRHWSVNLEYSYIDFGTSRLPYTLNLDFALPSGSILPGTSVAHEDEQLLKGGLTYRF